MKILHLLSQRPDSTGSGFYVREIIRESHTSGHTNILIAGAPAHDIPDLSSVPVDSVDFLCFESPELPFPIPGMSDVMPYRSTRFREMSDDQLQQYSDGFSMTIQSVVRKHQPDLIHTNHLWLMTSLVRQLFPDIPVVTSSHGTDLRQMVNCPHLRDRIVPLCRGINHVFALSRQQKKEIYRLFDIPEERITVTGSGFNTTLFNHEKKPETPPVKIVYAGKLSNSKGVPWLLESLRHRSLTDLPFHLYIAGSGSGPEKDTCIRLAEAMKERVTLCGSLRQNELADLMKQAHIFVLPSFYEGLPLVLFEALASGCRVITTNLPGALEIAENDVTGLIRFIDLPELETVDSPFESDMPVLRQQLAEALAGEIRNAIKEADIDIAAAGKLTVNYTWNAVFRRIDTVYREIVRQ